MRRSWWGYERIYEDMGIKRERGILEKRISRYQLAFWLLIFGWASGIIVSFLYLFRVWRALSIPANTHPLLSGAPQFTLLALIVALGAYLRQIRNNAVEQRDRIAAGGAWNYPTDKPYWGFTERRVRLLDNISLYLTLASPLVILLFMLIALRAFFEAMNLVDPLPNADLILRISDVIILGWTAAIFLMLTFTHFRARVRDDRTRAVSRTLEDKMTKQYEERRRKIAVPSQVSASDREVKPTEEAVTVTDNDRE